LKKELVKALAEKITELTSLVSKYGTNQVDPCTPHFNLIYRGLKVLKRKGSKVKTGVLKFDLVYQAQLNLDGDMVNFMDYEDKLLELFDHTLPSQVEYKPSIDLGDTTTYNQLKLYPIWNENDTTQEVALFSEDFNMTKRTFKIQLEYRT